MAKLTFRARDIDEPGALPGICCVCGAETTIYKKRTFSWAPSWIVVFIFIGLLIYVILSMVLTKKMTGHMPVCEKHRGHWFRRSVLPVLVLLAFVVVFFVGLVNLDNRPNAGFGLGQALMAAGGVGFLGSLIAAAVCQNGMVKPREITDREMTLGGLHADFVAATEAKWEVDDADRAAHKAKRLEEPGEPRPHRRSDER